MSKLKFVKVCLGKGYFLQVQFNYFWRMPNPGRRVSASYALVFKLSKLQKIFKDNSIEEFPEHIFGSDNLGVFFAENVLIKHILPLHPKDVLYSRLQFRLPEQNSREITKFNYEIAALRGTGVSPQEDPNVIGGNYSCRFSNENERSALSLRIKNVVSRAKLDYFINDLAEPLTYVERNAKGEKLEISFILAGLTLNKTFDSLYDSFDTILEKII